MINGKKIVVVLPAYNAEKTLEATVRELPDLVDETILVDDYSRDQTVAVARRLGLSVHVHDRNRGYGGNQKTCYAQALARGADVVVMTHPDYQYSPLLVTAMASMVAYGVYDLSLGSRILGGGALRGGMPRYKYVANRAADRFSEPRDGREPFGISHRLSRVQPGTPEALPLERNSDDFVFDNQMLAQAVLYGARIGEISCPTLYFPKPRRSICVAARSTGSACCGPRCSSGWRNGESTATEIFEFDARSRRPKSEHCRGWRHPATDRR